MFSYLSKVSNTTRILSLRKMSNISAPIESMIREKLSTKFNPVHLEIVNESYKHSVPKGSESHFKVYVVSDDFKDKKLLDRHRMVNDAIHTEEGVLPVHALSIKAQTIEQYQNENNTGIQQSPNCKGGSGK